MFRDASRRNWIYFGIGLAALLIGLMGQLGLSTDPLFAAGLYLAAVILAVFALRQQPGPSIKLAAAQPITPSKSRRWGYAIGGLAVVLAGVAFGLFGEPESPAVPWLLHLLSLVLAVVAAWLMDRGQHSDSTQEAAWSRWEIILLAAIFIIAAFMRLYRFDQIPFGLWYDEAVYGSNALEILNTPNFLPVYAEQPMLPAHLIYLIAFSFKLLGVSVLSIRAVAVVFGLGTVAAAYFTGKELFGRKWGLVLAFLLAVSRWDVNWSRIGMHGVTVPFFELLTLGLIVRAIRRQRSIDYTLAGLVLGLGLCFYFSFRLFPIVIGLFLGVLWLTRRDLIRTSWRGLILFALSAALAYVPIAQFSVRHADVFWSRVGDTSIFKDKTPEAGWQAVVQTTQAHLLMFNYRGDGNGRHNLPAEPMLDPISGTLLVLGLALSLWRIRQPVSFLLVVWLFVMLTPGIFSLDYEAPQSLRAIGSLPAAYLLAVVPIHAVWQAWKKLTLPRFQNYLLIPLGLSLMSVGYLNYSVYFDRQANAFESWVAFSTPETIAGKVMAELGNTAEYYVSTFYYKTPTIRFLAPEVTDYTLWETYDTLPVRSDGQKRLVFLVDAERKAFVAQAKKYYPAAAIREFTAPDGQPVLYEVNLSPTDVQASQGLIARYYSTPDWSGQPTLEHQVKTINFDWRDSDPVALPASVEWTSTLFAPKYGQYRISVQSPTPIELAIDEVPVTLQDGASQSVIVSLAKGGHTFRLRAQGQAGHYQLDWQPPDEEPAVIPASVFLLPPVTNNGLLARYYADPQWSGEVAFAQIDPWINFYFQNPSLPRPYTVEWTGRINIPSQGHYLFGLESIDESTLWIDGQLVLDNQTLNQYQESGIDLEAGFHAIRVRFGDRTGYTHINLYWTPPESASEIIPQSVLFPPQGEPDLLGLK